ncbi:MAG: methyltransferase [Clostridiales bacterium]|nr:methyltransferase [Clostridiales bacterium]
MELLHDESITEINADLKLIQKRDGLTFGSDAYLLSAYVRRSPRARVADLGSGTGVIPLLLLARNKAAVCEAIEAQSEFAELVDRNAELNGFSECLHGHALNVRELTPERIGGIVDIAVSNPPYMKPVGGESDSERRQIARHELLGGIADFCAAAYRVLKHGGLFYVVYRPDRLCDLICALRDARLEPKRITFVHARHELEPCLVLCEAKKGAAAGIYVTPPLIMYESGNIYTDVLNKIYEMGEFDEPYKRP